MDGSELSAGSAASAFEVEIEGQPPGLERLTEAKLERARRNVLRQELVRQTRAEHHDISSKK
eukprot:7178827-Lingulodinium_polyedra.AAC.1